MRRAEVRKIFEEHRGEAAQLARRLGKADQSVWDVLTGRKKSKLILAAATERAYELIALDQEKEREDAGRARAVA